MSDVAAMNSLDCVDLFRELSSEKREEAGRLCTWKLFHAQEQIIDRQGDNNDVYFITYGRARVVVYSIFGRELTLTDLGPGDYFGELAAIDGNLRSASVMALENTWVGIMSAEAFMRITTSNPGAARVVMRRLAEMVRNSTDRIVDLSTLGANNRVHAELLRQALAAGVDAAGQATITPIPVHADLASRVSTTRETVARVLNDLARKGIVRRGRNALIVPNVGHLQAMVEEMRGE